MKKARAMLIGLVLMFVYPLVACGEIPFVPIPDEPMMTWTDSPQVAEFIDSTCELFVVDRMYVVDALKMEYRHQIRKCRRKTKRNVDLAWRWTLTNCYMWRNMDRMELTPNLVLTLDPQVCFFVTIELR